MLSAKTLVPAGEGRGSTSVGGAPMTSSHTGEKWRELAGAEPEVSVSGSGPWEWGPG